MKKKKTPFPLVFYNIESNPISIDEKLTFINAFLQANQYKPRFIITKLDYKKDGKI